MAHNGDWIPHAQNTFVPWTQQYVNGVNDWAAPLGLPAQAVTTLKTGQTAFISAWEELAAREKSVSVNAAKQALVDARKTVIRDFHNQHIRYNKALTNEMRGTMGIPLPDDHHSHIPVGPNHVAFTLEPKGAYQIELKCWDEETGEKKITYGKSGIVAVYAISNAPITDRALLTQSELLTKTAHLFGAESSQRGQWLSVSVCWQSKTGEKGPWAVIQSAVIP